MFKRSLKQSSDFMTLPESIVTQNIKEFGETIITLEMGEAL